MSEEKTVPAMSDAELERMLAQAGAARDEKDAAVSYGQHVEKKARLAPVPRVEDEAELARDTGGDALRWFRERGEDVRHLPLCSAAAFENAREGRGALRCGPLERGDGRP